MPAHTHCLAAASQPARLKMKVIAGSRPSRSSRAMTSGRDGGRQPRFGRACRRAGDRVEVAGALGDVAQQRRVDDRWPSAPSPDVLNRSNIREPTSMCCHSGTGRSSCTITRVSPRTDTSHSPNSSALLTVADSDTSRTAAGRWMITSSHTAPRNRSPR